MKTRIRKIALISIWVLLAGGVAGLLYFIDRHKKNQVCTRVDITIADGSTNHFIDSIRVMNAIQMYPLSGMHMMDIDAGKLESLLENDPHIRNAEVFKALDGSVSLQIWQKQALLRVMNSGGESYYVDEDDQKMPLSANYTARVLVCNGSIDEQYTKCDTVTTLAVKTCTSIAHFVNNSTFWKSMIEQIFVSADNTIVLIPKLGDAKIIFGDETAIEDKFNRLYSFYRQALPKAGWNKYKSIDVSFRNQIVAKK